MKSSVSRIIVILAVALSGLSVSLHAQVCTIKYLSALYRSTLFDTITNAVFTPSNEVVATGTIMDLNGFVRKYSAGGTLLWSKRYNTVYIPYANRYFGYITLHDVVCAGDSNYIVTGSVSEIFYGFGITLQHMGLIMKLDRYGNIKWSRAIRSVFGDELSVAASLATKEGDFIAYVSTDNGPHVFSFGKLICYDTNGNLKWSTLLNLKELDNGDKGLFPKRSLHQLQNGNILLGDIAYTTDSTGTMPPDAKSVLFISAFDHQNGRMIWNTGYQLPFIDREKADLNAITESDDHKLTFYTTLRFASGAKKKITEIVTDANGLLLHATGIYPANGSECKLIKAWADPASGKQTLFLDAGGDPVIAGYDPATGQLSSRSFTTAGHFAPATMAKGTKHDYVLLKDMSNLNSQFLMTDSDGSIPCADLQLALRAEPVSINPLAERINLYDRPNIDSFVFDGFGLMAIPYPLTRTVECQSAAQCCNNTSDSSQVNLCPGDQYILPDRTVIRDSGSYYVTLQTPLGCDSVKFYHVSLQKDPNILRLGRDTCMMGQSSITLNATPGFDSYNWRTTVTTTPELNVTAPGLYQVTVSNICGSKTDSIQVFDQCEFPVYIPSAFTPNGDGLNDVFRIPPSNKNRLRQMRIYNRWGQIIYSTRDASAGWDGTVRGKLADNGTYIYYLEMEGLSGNPVTKKGTITLIR